MSRYSRMIALPGWGLRPVFPLIAGYSKVASSRMRHEGVYSPIADQSQSDD